MSLLSNKNNHNQTKLNISFILYCTIFVVIFTVAYLLLELDIISVLAIILYFYAFWYAITEGIKNCIIITADTEFLKFKSENKVAKTEMMSTNREQNRMNSFEELPEDKSLLSIELEKLDYQIISRLAQNHNQNRITYLAFDRTNERKVVTKEFGFSEGSTWQQYQNIEREFKVLQKLNHPGIPKYVALHQSNRSYYLVLEYIEAQNLSNVNLEPSEVWQIARQVLDILDYLNQQKIVHKDIKPSNILWDRKDAYLIDFGFASDLDYLPGISSTLLGSPGFIAPEQLYRGKICHQGDLYGLGVTLFCLLFGIQEKEISSYLDSNFNLCLDRGNITLPLSYQNWLKKMTAFKTELRFPNAARARKELEKLENPQTSSDSIGLLKTFKNLSKYKSQYLS